MRQVCRQFEGHAGVNISVMFAKIGHQMTRLVALPLAVADHDNPPATHDSRCDGIEELYVCGVGFGAVGIMLGAVDLMRQVTQFLRCGVPFTVNRKYTRAGMVDDNDQIVGGRVRSVGHGSDLPGQDAKP